MATNFREVDKIHIQLKEKVGSGCTAEVFRGFLMTPHSTELSADEQEDWISLMGNGGQLFTYLQGMTELKDRDRGAQIIAEAFNNYGQPQLNNYQKDPGVSTRVDRIRHSCICGDFGNPIAGLITEVAVKQIDWNKSRMGFKEQQAFDREVAIMPNINHANLVAFLGVSSLQRPFRIITEFCSGGCCFELLHNSDHIELVWSQTYKMIDDVATAMAYLHSFNPQIIHRDLKSLNLLLAQPVRSDKDVPLVKVSDFGLSRMKEKAVETEEVGTWGKMTIAAGTCHWMAPEVFQGGSYDEKVDVYSYSMILFETICREIPFEEEEPAQVGPMVCNGERPDMEAVPPDVPQEISALMQLCWHRNPAERPTFEQILDTLRTINHQYGS